MFLTNILQKNIAEKAMEMCHIDTIGLTKQDYMLLTTIHTVFNGGPVGINTLAAILGEQEITIEEFLEPFLLQIGFIERTPRGRVITLRAKKHLEKQSVLP